MPQTVCINRHNGASVINPDVGTLTCEEVCDPTFDACGDGNCGTGEIESCPGDCTTSAECFDPNPA